MKLGVLFSGGKDSCYALHLAMQNNHVVCLISIISENKESYMFHTPNIELTRIQAEAIGLPIVIKTTKGEKEIELADLKKAIKEAKQRFNIEGIVTGAIASVYQASRIKKICDELNLTCINPLWGMDQIELLKEICNLGFEVVISGVFAHPLDEGWLGKKLDATAINELAELQKRYKINPAGEGGELETTVLDAPFFKKRIVIKKTTPDFKKNSGIIRIEEADLIEKR